MAATRPIATVAAVVLVAALGAFASPLADAPGSRVATSRTRLSRAAPPFSALRGGTAAQPGAHGAVETHAFQAEMSQLMALIINTFYSNRDIFLRELVSNAADAIDKARYGALTEGGGTGAEHEIRLVADRRARTLAIEDSGVGMSREELVSNLGTVAHSGTKAFMEAARKQRAARNADTSAPSGAAAAELIGQFGVGFYSAFLVADRVSVYTRRAGGPLLKWESDAAGSYSIQHEPPADEVRATAGAQCRLLDERAHGTAVVLSLKPDAGAYLKEAKLAELVKLHSSFVQPPIKLWAMRARTDKDPPAPARARSSSAADSGILDWRPLNELKPLWLRAPDEVSEAEYHQFYMSTAPDFEPPLCFRHLSLEGRLQLRALLFIPRRAPPDIFDSRARASGRAGGLKLYVRRVFICSASAETECALLPEWASFVRGIVDSDDLELNISRERLQRSRAAASIRKALTKRVLEMIETLARRAEAEEGGASGAYDDFYAAFAKSLKLGVHEDDAHRERLVRLLRFPSTHTERRRGASAAAGPGAAAADGGGLDAAVGAEGFADALLGRPSAMLAASNMTSLDAYVARMPPHQKAIYFIAGESLSAVRSAPALERLRAAGFEVLFLVDPMDEYALGRLKAHAGRALVSATQEGLELEAADNATAAADAQRHRAASERFAELCSTLQQLLGPSRVEKVSEG